VLDVNLPQAFNLATVLAGEGIATTVEVHRGARTCFRCRDLGAPRA
jgi:hypothetical protein